MNGSVSGVKWRRSALTIERTNERPDEVPLPIIGVVNGHDAVTDTLTDCGHLSGEGGAAHGAV